MSTIVDQYKEKGSAYFEYERPEMLVMIPDHVRRVLGFLNCP
jgi:hypothetical protein